MPLFETEVKTGETRRVGSLELTPTTIVLKILLPGNHGGLVWNRPRAVIVRGEDGVEYTLPVTDVTRITMWAMLAGGLIGALVIGIASGIRRNNP
jgi:hypothetical protein